MRWLGFEANLPALQNGIQCVSSFSSNDFTRWSPSVPPKMTNFSGQPAFLYLSTGYHVLAMASTWEQRLFRSAHPEVWWQFESGVWSSKYGIFTLCTVNCMCTVNYILNNPFLTILRNNTFSAIVLLRSTWTPSVLILTFKEKKCCKSDKFLVSKQLLCSYVLYL